MPQILIPDHKNVENFNPWSQKHWEFWSLIPKTFTILIPDSTKTLLIPIPSVVIPDPGAVIPDLIYLVTTLLYNQAFALPTCRTTSVRYFPLGFLTPNFTWPIVGLYSKLKLQIIKPPSWSCLHCFLDFGLMHPNFPVFSLTFENLRSTCFSFCFPYSTTKTYLWNLTGETVTGKWSLSPLSAVLPVLNVRGSTLLSSLCRAWWCIPRGEIDILKSSARMLA